MSRATIVDWTNADVLLKFDEHRAVRYRVYQEGHRYYLEIQDLSEKPVHTLELPDGMKLDKSSYEVLLRYVLLDVVAA